MINIRYHIVSITAVFLALGIGVALGSTFIEAATVDILNRNIRSAEERINETNAENRELASRLEQSNARDTALSLLAGDDLLAGRLEDVPVVVVVPPGLDPSLVVPVTTSLGWTDADLHGTIYLTEAMRFGDDRDEEIADALGLDAASGDALHDEVFAALRDELAASSTIEAQGGDAPGGEEPATGGDTADDGAEPGGPPPPDGGTPSPGTTAPDPTPGADTEEEEEEEEVPPSTSEVLAANGYLRFEPGPGHRDDAPIPTGVGVRYVFLDQPDLDVASSRMLTDLMPIDADSPIPVIVVTSPSGAEPRNLALAVRSVREDPRLAGRYSTVDHLDTFAGLVATVFALERGPLQGADHHGHGDRATSVLAPPP